MKERLPERVLPSHGLYCNDISYLLREFGFSTMIYAEYEDRERAKSVEEDTDFRIGLISELLHDNTKIDESMWSLKHEQNLHKWFHYYIESAIPVLAITTPNRYENRHATLVIGHGIQKKELKECPSYKLGDLYCVDTADLYDHYIVQDDNQVPYRLEKYNKFTEKRNHKLEAFIVPLERHVFLEVSSAISIFDAFISYQSEMISDSIEAIKNQICTNKKSSPDEDKEEYEKVIHCLSVGQDNPITIRYYLVKSADYKCYRISNSDDMNEKRFYADVSMPRSSWIA